MSDSETKPLAAQTHYAHANDCIEQELDDELLIFNPHTTATVYLNQTAKVIWQLCPSFSIEEIIDTLQNQFPLQAQSIPEDVNSAVADLTQQAILVAK